jgi:hypothetical protein
MSTHNSASIDTLDWTDKDNRIVQYSILTNISLRDISKATHRHNGVRLFGIGTEPRHILSQKKRCTLLRSLKRLQRGSKRSLHWDPLPDTYNPATDIGNIDEDIFRPLSPLEFASQFSVMVSAQYE